MADPSPTPGLLARFGLEHREARAWAWYDWANSAFITVIITAVYPVYFANVAAKGLAPGQATQYFAVATTVSLLIVALLAPLLGAMADMVPLKKRFLLIFMLIGAGATGLMYQVGPGDWKAGLILFVIASVGAYGSFVFYDALLPHVAPPGRIDRLSTAGYAMGYLGGGLLLAVNLAWITVPDWFGLSGPVAATRLAFVSVALWWVGFAVPLLKTVPEPPVAGGADGDPRARPTLSGGWRQLRGTLRELMRYREAALLLLAFLIYNDGIVTIIRMATLYGAEIGIDQGYLIGAILMVQWVGIPFTLLFGRVAGRVGTKKAILFTLMVYCVIALVGFRMTTTVHFFLLALMVATVQGGCQALSRSLFASMIPKQRSGEFFAFYAIAEKCASVLGPATFAGAIWLTGSSRWAVLLVALFFIVGAQILMRVDVDAGRARAAAENR